MKNHCLSQLFCYSILALFIAKTTTSAPQQQYKKLHRDQVTAIARGEPQAALAWTQNYLKENPNDPESYFIQVLAYSAMNQPENAISVLRKALKTGLPFERFLAGPRNLFASLYRSKQFQEILKEQLPFLIHGPVLGAVTENRCRIWLRTWKEEPVLVQIAGSADMRRPVFTKSVNTQKENDYTAVINVENLQPDSRYYYRILSEKEGDFSSPIYSFRTFPVRTRGSKFTIGFGGGAGYTPWHEYMWETIYSHRPIAFLTLGDNVYIDTPTVPETQRYGYYRRQSRPEYRRFTANTPIFAIWDDHDFGTNDCTSSLQLDSPPWKLAVHKIFKQNYVNPAYGGGAQDPGCWFGFSIADVDFFLLDCRFYRQNPKKVKAPTMLGLVQKKWLLDRLAGSQATFKIIASSVPWAPGVKPGSKDTWDGFAQEREEIFSFIEKNKIEGVLLLSADRHRSDARKIHRQDGYDFYDLMSSKLTNIHTHKLIENAAGSEFLFGYNEKCSFGLLTFDTSLPDPELVYEIISIDDETIYDLKIKKSELSF